MDDELTLERVARIKHIKELNDFITNTLNSLKHDLEAEMKELETSVSQNNDSVASTVSNTSITADEFAETCNSSIGNLPLNSMVNIPASYIATDMPQDKADSYYVITSGDENSQIQIALNTGDQKGRCFIRVKTDDVWGDWSSNTPDNITREQLADNLPEQIRDETMRPLSNEEITSMLDDIF